ncbi:hypothetical protein [Nostoc sp.]
MKSTLTKDEIEQYQLQLLLTPDEWQQLREYAPVVESRELVTA